MSQIRQQTSQLAIAIVLTFIAVYSVFALTWSGVIGALLMATILASLTAILGGITLAIQYQRQKSAYASKQKSVDNMATHQTRTIEIDVPLDAAFDLATDALSALDGAAIPKTLTGIPSKQTLNIHKSEREIGRIEAGLRAKTAGIQDVMDFSQVDIQLQRIDAGTTRIQIGSRPTIRLENFDMGRHTHYVNLLAQEIRRSAHEASAEIRLSDSTPTDNDESSQTQDRTGYDQQ